MVVSPRLCPVFYLCVCAPHTEEGQVDKLFRLTRTHDDSHAAVGLSYTKLRSELGYGDLEAMVSCSSAG